MLKTRFTDLLELSMPVMSAPMSNHSGGQLAAAVSQAGGLGTFGGTNDFGLEWMRQQIAHVRTQTDRAFGVGFITHLLEYNRATLKSRWRNMCRYSCFPSPIPGRGCQGPRTPGAVTVCQVQSLDLAEQSVEAGTDVLLAQGNEAGGHTGEMNLLPLLVALVERFPDVPVLAAGGVTTGRALAGVMGAGAEGASLGTAVLATPEAVEVPDAFKERIIVSDGQDTTFTRVYDLLGTRPWPEGIAGRVYRNRLVREWDERDAEILARREELASDVAAARAAHDTELSAVYMGQGAGHITAVRPVAEVVREICDDAERILRGLSATLAG